MDTYLDERGSEQPERRRSLKLRLLYDDATEHIDHFFHSSHEWAGSSRDYLALRVVHEAYPGLTSDEVHILVRAIARASRSPWAQGSALLADSF
jgi:hypothetical protein